METKAVKKEEELKNIKTVFSDTDDSIVIPKKMTKLEASEELRLQHAEEEKIVDNKLSGIKDYLGVEK